MSFTRNFWTSNSCFSGSFDSFGAPFPELVATDKTQKQKKMSLTSMAVILDSKMFRSYGKLFGTIVIFIPGSPCLDYAHHVSPSVRDMNPHEER